MNAQNLCSPGRAFAALVCLCLALLGSVPSAEANRRPFQFDLAIGHRLSSDHNVTDARVYSGYVGASQRSSSSWFWGVGLHTGMGASSLCEGGPPCDARRYDRWALGPEVRLGWLWGFGAPDAFLYVSAAPVYSRLSRTEGVIEDATQQNFSLRSSLAFSYRGWMSFVSDRAWECGGGACNLWLLLLVLPNHIEITHETMSTQAAGQVNLLGLGAGWSF